MDLQIAQLWKNAINISLGIQQTICEINVRKFLHQDLFVNDVAEE